MSSRTLWEKDWRGRDRVETPELILSELNCDFVRKFITALSHSSQCTESQVYWSGANWHSRCWPLNCDSWCTVSVELKIKRQEATTKQIIEGWHNHKHNNVKNNINATLLNASTRQQLHRFKHCLSKTTIELILPLTIQMNAIGDKKIMTSLPKIRMTPSRVRDGF